MKCLKMCSGGLFEGGILERADKEDLIPSSCGMLVYREQASMVTKRELGGSRVGSWKMVCKKWLGGWCLVCGRG